MSSSCVYLGIYRGHAGTALDVFASFDKTLADLETDYLDLILIHWPLPMHYGGDLASPWKAMIELLKSGRVRAIGVSNFEPEHLEQIIDATGVVLAVNQIEAHPCFPDNSARVWYREHGIEIEANSTQYRMTLTKFACRPLPNKRHQ